MTAVVPPVAAATNSGPSVAPEKIRVRYIVTCIVFIGVSVILAVILFPKSHATYQAVQGISVFAVLYVLAQSVERVTLFVSPLIDRALNRNGSPTIKKRKSDSRETRIAATHALLQSQAFLSLDSANTTALRNLDTAADTASAAATDDSQTQKSASTEGTLLASAISFALAFTLIAIVKFSILGAIGYSGVPQWLDLIIAATAIMGGSAGLHDLITNLQAPKAAASS